MPRMIGLNEAAKEVGLSRWEMLRGIHAGIYPHLRIGLPGKRGKFLIDMDMLHDVLTDRINASMATKSAAEVEGENIIGFPQIRRVAQ